MKKCVIAALCLLICLFSWAGTAYAAETLSDGTEKNTASVTDFDDVRAGAWYYNDVCYTLENGLFKGVSPTSFEPDTPMTRAMFVTVLGRYSGINDASASAPGITVFDDVRSSSYYASHVQWAFEQKIVRGMTSSQFSPDSQITRQDMVTMLVRFAAAKQIELPEPDGGRFADDADISGYAKDAVYRMKAADVIRGKSADSFDPKGKATRAEVAAVLHRFIDLITSGNLRIDDSNAVIVSVEKFTLGQGYLIEPTVVKLEDGDTAATVTARLAAQNGLEIEYDGGMDSGFYLIKIQDNENQTVNLPQYISDVLTAEQIPFTPKSNSEWLGEFDYTTYSGWMIWVSGLQIPVSAGAWPVEAGDVVRWQFTVFGYGADLGKGSFSICPPLIDPADKDALTRAVAIASVNERETQAYADALTVLQKMDATQAEVDAALAALQN